MFSSDTLSALDELDVTFIETVLLSFPESENEELTLEAIQPYWKALEKLVYREMVLSLGLADLDKALLEALHDWAEVRILELEHKRSYFLFCFWGKT